MNPSIIKGEVSNTDATSPCGIPPEKGSQENVYNNENPDYDEDLSSGTGFAVSGIHDTIHTNAVRVTLLEMEERNWITWFRIFIKAIRIRENNRLNISYSDLYNRICLQ